MDARLSELFSNIHYLLSHSSMDPVEKGMVCAWLNEVIGEMGSTGHHREED
jgi:hypothetical protein